MNNWDLDQYFDELVSRYEAGDEHVKMDENGHVFLLNDEGEEIGEFWKF